jgi:hypothetical protein
MAELHDLESPRPTLFSRRQLSKPDYQNVPIDADDPDDGHYRASTGLGVSGLLNRLSSGLSPVSPMSPEANRSGAHSERTSQQATPAFSNDFPSPAWISKQSSFYNPHDSTANLLRSDRPQSMACPTSKDILIKPWSAINLFMLFLALYTFVFSGVFLGIALAKPRWGHRIGKDGMSPSTATLLSALFSKTTELSFVAVLVTTIGQILSRRAIARKSAMGPKGITIAEMTMRSWILQPGLIFTHVSSLKYAGPTMLGVLVLVSTFAATFYTTACEALAAPKLMFGPYEQKNILTDVQTMMANATFLSQSCDTPIVGDDEAGPGCLQIDYAGRAYHNFQGYLTNWTAAVANGDPERRLTIDSRPRVVSNVWDNTTVIGQWITPSGENITRDSERHGRLVNNVTLAMPHANLVHAARDRRNEIAQPEELDGQGEYFVIASIPAPTLNILCVGMTTDEVTPLIYNANDTERPASGPTAVDDIFGFGDGEGAQQAPLFPRLPIEYNTVNNNSIPWGQTSVYLISTPPTGLDTADHVLCSLKLMQYPHCTTKYHAAESGGTLSVHCDDDQENTRPYTDVNPGAVPGIYDPNWKDIGAEFLKAGALSHGVSDGNASIARIVTQMTPRWNPDDPTTLSPDLPTIGEALAALAGSTTVLSSLHASFNVSWTGGPDTEQSFPASVKYKDYASGGTADWQGIFYVILFIVFLINLFAFYYLVKNLCTDGQVTDYTEPQNMFSLAVLSPPSQILSGSCGGGPDDVAYGKRWQVDMLETSHAMEGQNHPHFYVRCTEDPKLEEQQMVGSVDRGSTIVKRRSRVRSMYDAGESATSPVVDQYRRLAG